MGERFAIEMLHDEIGWIAVRGRITRRALASDVVKDAHVRMLESRDSLCFASESLDAAGSDTSAEDRTLSLRFG